jgi:WXG100 protein secretion system (Wss), protein YukD
MTTLLITVAVGMRRRDLAVRADVPIADLLEPIAELLGNLATAVAPPPIDPGGRPPLGLAPLGGQKLPVARSLEQCGIGHGEVLVLVGGR